MVFLEYFIIMLLVVFMRKLGVELTLKETVFLGVLFVLCVFYDIVMLLGVREKK